MSPMDGEIRDPDHADAAAIFHEDAEKGCLSRTDRALGGRGDHRDPMSTVRERFRELPHEQCSGADFRRKDGGEHQDVHALIFFGAGGNISFTCFWTTERTAEEIPGPKLACCRMRSQCSRNQRIVFAIPSSKRVEGS